jgi:hypothetical protein
MDKPKCLTCGVVLNQPGKPETEDCGGDCLKCMAEAGDPDCIEALKAKRGDKNEYCNRLFQNIKE